MAMIRDTLGAPLLDAANDPIFDTLGDQGEEYIISPIGVILTSPPTAPSRNDPANFRTRADAWVDWLTNNCHPEFVQLISETNEFVSETVEYVDIATARVAEFSETTERAKDYAVAVTGATYWISSGTYILGRGVIGSDGYTYISLISSNHGNDPTTDDGTNWKRVTGPFPGGVGSTTSAVDVTFVFSDPRYQSVDMTASGKYVKLPDAQTLVAGPEFIFENVGVNPFYIVNYSATALAIVPPGETATCYLKSSATQAGDWNVAVTGTRDRVLEGDLVAVTDVVMNNFASVSMSASVTLVAYRNDSDSALYIEVINSETGAIIDGPDQVSTHAVTMLTGCKINSTDAFFCSYDASFSGGAGIMGFIARYSGGVLSIADGPDRFTTNVPTSISCCVANSSNTDVIILYQSAGTVYAAVEHWTGSVLSNTVADVTIENTGVLAAVARITPLASNVYLCAIPLATPAVQVSTVAWNGTTGFTLVDSLAAITDCDTAASAEVVKLNDDGTYIWCAVIYLKTSLIPKLIIAKVTKADNSIAYSSEMVIRDLTEKRTAIYPYSSIFYSATLGMIVSVWATHYSDPIKRKMYASLVSWDSAEPRLEVIGEYPLGDRHPSFLSSFRWCVEKIDDENGSVLFGDVDSTTYGVFQRFQVIP